MGLGADLRIGLSAPAKSIPCKYLYDERGARLFEQICRLRVYYPTLTELGILERHASDIARAVGPDLDLVELGSGSATKTRLLLSALQAVGLYVPVDLAREQLQETAQAFRRDYPSLCVQPVCADFSQELELPERRAGARTLVFFPGSTLGNFEPAEARALLGRIRRLCAPDGGALIGVDLKKDPAVLHRAYNDESGVTAAFNTNVLVRANRELGADFVVSRFRHYAYYDPGPGRIVMTLVSMRRQTVRIGPELFELAEGEPITTEYSYKYELGQLAELAASAGLAAREAWVDPSHYFALVLLRPH